MEILKVVTERCKFRATGVNEGIVRARGEILTVQDPNENVDEKAIAIAFKEKQREEMEKYGKNAIIDFIGYGLDKISNRIAREYYEYWLSEIPIDKVIIIKKWNFEMEIKVFYEEYEDYWDMVADYQDIIYNPEIKVLPADADNEELEEEDLF
ncbi:MAG: hypothetical protein JHC31_11075 [Sulfurihydrogenibium sp.]|jgi:hypothetical protein|nr:hypothetical protein [Sulfurihydrogenibium sp.]